MMEDMEYTPEIITLTDEDGNDHDFELLEYLEDNGNLYCGLIACPDDPEALLTEEQELEVLKVCEKDGMEYFSTIESDEEYERIVRIFLDMYADAEESEEE